MTEKKQEVKSKTKKGKSREPYHPNKQAQIEQRRLKVFVLWFWGFKEVEIAQVCKVSSRTVQDDVKAVRSWADERQVSFKDMRNLLELQIGSLMKDSKLALMKLKKPEAQIHFSIKVASTLIEMWKKLMPTEIRLEGVMSPPFDPEWFDKTTEDMGKREPKNRSNSNEPS